MSHPALSYLLGVAYAPAHRLARFCMWFYVVYGVLILIMAMAADRAAVSIPVYGKPLATAMVIHIIDRIYGAAIAKKRAG